MTKNEYLDGNRFPLTTQPGLTLDQQMMIDAHNLDELKEMLALGEPLNQKQERVRNELETKRAVWSTLTH